MTRNETSRAVDRSAMCSAANTHPKELSYWDWILAAGRGKVSDPYEPVSFPLVGLPYVFVDGSFFVHFRFRGHHPGLDQ